MLPCLQVVLIQCCFFRDVLVLLQLTAGPGSVNGLAGKQSEGSSEGPGDVLECLIKSKGENI